MTYVGPICTVCNQPFYEIYFYETNLYIILLVLYVNTTRISIQSIWIADYACILKNQRGNVVDSI